jgi:hypothetical protein
MSITLGIRWDDGPLAALKSGKPAKAAARALKKAGATALRDMRSEASKRVRQRKRLKASLVREAIHMRVNKASSIEGMEWALEVRGKPVPLAAFPHRQGTRGVSVEVNRGKRSLVEHAFVATMRSGHRGIFVREGLTRLPIRELFGSRPVDALLHQGEADAVAERGRASLEATFARLLPLELAKEGK